MAIVTDLIISNETPAGDIDGVNKVFTLDKAPNPEKSLELFLNGKLQVIDVDYTLYNLTITFETAPWSGSNLKIHYRYVEIAELYLELARITDAGSLAGQDTADFNDDVDGAEKPENNADVTGDHQGDIDGSNINNNENWTDDVAAAAAQATADGKIVTFLQDTEPTADGVGDLWIDTNDTNKLYRWNGADWISVTDTDIAQAIVDAAAAQATADSKTDDTAADAAQATADSKIITFYQDAPPTAEAIGDFWIDTNDNNKPYRWSGAAWVAIDNPVSDWSLVVDDDGNKPANNATEGAVIDKLIWDRFTLAFQFVTLDGWNYTGTGVTLLSVAQVRMETGSTINTTKDLYAEHTDDNDNAGAPGANPEMQTTVKLSHATSQNVKIVIGDVDDVLIGFKIVDGTLYAVYTDNSVTEYTTVITGITLTHWNTYRVVFIGGTSIKFYVNGILKHTATTNLPTNALTTFADFQIKNTAASSRRLAIQNLIYIQDFFN